MCIRRCSLFGFCASRPHGRIVARSSSGVNVDSCQRTLPRATIWANPEAVMKKVIKWSALALVLIVVAIGAIYYFYINSIVESVVEKQGTTQMNLKTELDGARVAIFGGELGLDDLQIANPTGFSAPHLFTLDKVNVKTALKQLRGNPKRI